MKTLLKFLFLTILLNSCYEGVLIDTKPAYTNIKFRVLDNNDSPILNAKVNIEKNSLKIIFDSTNQEGELLVRLIEGEYKVTVIVKDNYINYTSSRYFQVIGGLESTFEFRPYKKTGNLILHVINNWTEKLPIRDVNVILLANQKFIIGAFYDYYKYKIFENKTNISGIVSFNNIPTNYNFRLLIYKDTTKYEIYSETWNFFIPEDDSIKESTVYFNYK